MCFEIQQGGPWGWRGKERERGGVARIKEEMGNTVWGLADCWRELDFDSGEMGSCWRVFKQRKDVILHRTRKDASQISARVEAGRQERRMCLHLDGPVTGVNGKQSREADKF